jgi:bacillithiol synthase
MFTAQKVSYAATNSFSTLVLDYVAESTQLESFYAYAPNEISLAQAIHDRKRFPIDRALLVQVLKEQYKAIVEVEAASQVYENIDLLLQENTFTVTTAHQPNIFTGHLYFFYKIIHAIKLAQHLKAQHPTNNFVPVFYMGSEDADVAELGEITIKGKTFNWQTTQTGAVGNMLVDDALLEILQELVAQLQDEPYLQALQENLLLFFTKGTTIEQATFKLVHYLFAQYGLVVLLPNNAALKTAFNPIVNKELTEQFSAKAVAETIAAFPKEYKVQASGRAINLFYLKDNFRERIEQQGEDYVVVNTNYRFTKAEILTEVEKNPQHFSANVVLRPVYQETILPNIAFIGGGGEIAYWLELQQVFKEANTFFPALVLRNSFGIVDDATQKKIERLELNYEQLFASEFDLINSYVKRHAKHNLTITEEGAKLKAVYETLEIKAAAIDETLVTHVRALHAKAENKLNILQKKMLKAEKKHFDWQQEHIQKIRASLFPRNGLQERVDNGLAYVAKYGSNFVEAILEHSNAFKAEFTILTEKHNG